MEDIESAKRNLEIILNRNIADRNRLVESFMPMFNSMYPDFFEKELPLWLKNVYEWYRLDTWFFLKRDSPEILAKGTHQVVISLGGEYVAKFIPKTLKKKQIDLQDNYVIHQQNCFYKGNCELSSTLNVLRELGFTVPYHQEVEARLENERIVINEVDGVSNLILYPTFVIAEDLTKGGRYVVEDIKKKHFQELINGAEIKDEFAKYTQLLMKVYEKRDLPYVIIVNDHAGKESPINAFKHMFFVQIDPQTNSGKLIVGDLDHVILCKIQESPQ